MSSYRQILYHVIFRTKDSKKSLTQTHIKELYAYILGIIKNKNCILYRINGIEDHIHILSDLHPSYALADYVKDIKVASSLWIKQSGKFQNFVGWSDGYAALTYAWRDKDIIENYIINQQKHHENQAFDEEYKQLLEEHGIKIDERFFP
jgi:putative transposase